MNKAFVDGMVRGMKLAGLVAKASPWTFEGYGEVQKSVRFVGLSLKDDWLELFSSQDNVLLKFVIDRNSAYLDCYLANKPPFIRIISTRFTDKDTWETLLGEFRRRMKRDKHDVIHHTDRIDNLYKKIEKDLKG